MVTIAVGAVVTVESVFFAFQAPVGILKKMLRSFLKVFPQVRQFPQPPRPQFFGSGDLTWENNAASSR